MKLFFFLLILGFSASSIAAKDISLKAIAPYTVVSDTYTNDLLTGQVRVKGYVMDATGVVIAGALVSTIDERVSGYTDQTGAYELIIHDSDTSLFVYKQGYAEVAMDRYDFLPGHTVVVNFFPTLESKGKVVNEFISYKPVIYLYSTTTLQVSLALDYLGELSFTYPAYEEGWNVNVDANGIHSTTDDRTYPYLFWEGEMDDLAYELEDGNLLGQIVATDTLVDFLETQLTAIGLNRNEQTDFITFWVPKMMGKKYVFVQFLLDDLYTNKVASLTVNTVPDAQKRVYLLFSGYDQFPTLESTPQTFKPFIRKGFTLVEWGGSELTPLKSI
jgi:hypothetical protein